jgi:flagellar FliL protein
MAEEEKQEEKKGGGNGMMIVLIVLIVLLLAAVGAIGYFAYSKGIFDDKPKEETAAKQVDQQTEEKENIGQTYQAQVDNLVLNITDAKGRVKLMKLSFTIKSTEPTIGALVDANKAEIVDAVIKQISARSSEELLTVGGKAMLKEEMVDEINNILNDAIGDNEEIKKTSVINIFFTSFVMK